MISKAEQEAWAAMSQATKDMRAEGWITPRTETELTGSDLFLDMYNRQSTILDNLVKAYAIARTLAKIQADGQVPRQWVAHNLAKADRLAGMTAGEDVKLMQEISRAEMGAPPK